MVARLNVDDDLELTGLDRARAARPRRHNRGGLGDNGVRYGALGDREQVLEAGAGGGGDLLGLRGGLPDREGSRLALGVGGVVHGELKRRDRVGASGNRSVHDRAARREIANAKPDDVDHPIGHDARALLFGPARSHDGIDGVGDGGDVLIRKVGTTTPSFSGALVHPLMAAVLLLYAIQIVLFTYVFVRRWELGIVALLQMAFYAAACVLIGRFLFGEQITLLKGLGMLLAFCGVVLMNIGR